MMRYMSHAIFGHIESHALLSGNDDGNVKAISGMLWNYHTSAHM